MEKHCEHKILMIFFLPVVLIIIGIIVLTKLF